MSASSVWAERVSPSPSTLCGASTTASRALLDVKALPRPCPRGGGAIAVHEVSFRYPDGDADVLSHISLRVPSGSSLALCGISGSGKTTLVDIILGLITPTSGTVTFNDVPTDTAGDAWHDIVAYVPQDVYITDSTLAGNVAFGPNRGGT
ncbi:ATP-binding cassette domain-containing protein [Dermacoccus abyssi]|uniref:ATP-binding cassette domain-containing protein n=1 Tax=Dermacoccus abyssi TaxID=322596 RepID=A0ABX5ZB13_9MICO|nr:ATP-binding cassette domain-containing protein [Dermacoccus abyssi]